MPSRRSGSDASTAAGNMLRSPTSGAATATTAVTATFAAGNMCDQPETTGFSVSTSRRSWVALSSTDR
jgi:hypothetical protein